MGALCPWRHALINGSNVYGCSGDACYGWGPVFCLVCNRIFESARTRLWCGLACNERLLRLLHGEKLPAPRPACRRCEGPRDKPGSYCRACQVPPRPCRRCEGPRDRPGSYCRACLATCKQERQARARARYDALRAQGKCGWCGRSAPGRAFCGDCVERARARYAAAAGYAEQRRARYERLKRDGLCVRCRREREPESVMMCQGCAEKHRAAQRTRRENLHD